MSSPELDKNTSRPMMSAVEYFDREKFDIVQVPIPQVRDDEVLLKVTYCGMCGTDAHIHKGEFASEFPLIPGHEAVGVAVEIGKDVKDFAKGDRCVADVGMPCDQCFYCRRGKPLLCVDFKARGVRLPGGFAEYIAYPQNKLYKINNISDLEATLAEPLACAIHGVDMIQPKVGSEILILGAGPTGLMLSQLLKLNGASKVVIAANQGIKMNIAKKLEAGDAYVELDRENPGPQWEKLKEDYPFGFDVVVEATGVQSVVQESINYVRRGGTLLVYGVYENNALVSWPPSKIFADEIRIIGSFSQTHCFPRTIEYLESGKIRTEGMVTDIFKLKDYQQALDKMNSRGALKIAIQP